MRDAHCLKTVCLKRSTVPRFSTDSFRFCNQTELMQLDPEHSCNPEHSHKQFSSAHVSFCNQTENLVLIQRQRALVTLNTHTNSFVRTDHFFQRTKREESCCRQEQSKLASQKRFPASPKKQFPFCNQQKTRFGSKGSFLCQPKPLTRAPLRSKLFFRKGKTVLDNSSSSFCRKNYLSAPQSYRFGSLPNPARFLLPLCRPGSNEILTKHKTSATRFR